MRLGAAAALKARCWLVYSLQRRRDIHRVDTLSSITNRWSAQSLRLAAYVVVLVALTVWSYGVSTAALLVASFSAAYVTEFHSFRCAAALLRRQNVSTWMVALALSGVAADVALIYFGFGLALGFAAGIFLLMDAVVLRFN